MSDTPRTIVRPRSGILPEEVRDVRARAWAYVFKCFHCHEENEGVPEDAERRSNGIGADEASIPRQVD